jgi:hypothetical protein
MYDIEIRTVRADPATAIKGPQGCDLATMVNLAGDTVYGGTSVYVTAVYPEDWNDAYLAGAPVPYLWAGVGLVETPGEDSPSGIPAHAAIWWDEVGGDGVLIGGYPGIHETMAMAQVLGLAARIGDDAEETFHHEGGDGIPCGAIPGGLLPYYPAEPCVRRDSHLSDHEDKEGRHWGNGHECAAVSQ